MDKQQALPWLVGLLALNITLGGISIWQEKAKEKDSEESFEYRRFLKTLRNYLSHHQVADQKLQQYYQELKDLLEQKEKETASLLASINLNLTEQLEMARKVQISFMPLSKSMIQRSEFRWAFWYQPAETIGGDLLDIIRVGRNGYAFVVADVSGHGIPSALLTSMTKVAFINHSAWGKDTTQVCSDVNKNFLKTLLDVGFYVTAFYAFLNLEKGILQYTSAGHMPLLYYRAKNHTIEQLHTKGTILGIFPDAVFESKIIHLEPHDKLFLFTDGLVEIQNKEGQWFGVENLEKVILHHAHLSPDRCVDAIRQEVIRFGWGEKPIDDQALLCVEFLHKTKEIHI
ncbi:PP2C family protein-serine/threonine phosphatase [Thermospira aquatica]|uniref:Serine/threonine-protein phosphatase n=1 Tax=Thermospira aquatica TaxID=2828656 RepID=A0AAX3BCW4_9SPIR|nr:PP2C family protein-serine/threonine phosphatase [Thermospira aquatica]URA10101.1 serine/threonine-protein phosphatase [Thermospira aquatica]